jgi:acyl-coenzyme A synthetase/AMP-(fatty) acid ligase
VDTLPYTPTGKIQKAVLKADKGLKLRAIDLQMPSKAT